MKCFVCKASNYQVDPNKIDNQYNFEDIKSVTGNLGRSRQPREQLCLELIFMTYKSVILKQWGKNKFKPPTFVQIY